MNLINLLTKEKSVAGIEISDSVVRIAFFRTSTQKNKVGVSDQKKEGETHSGLVDDIAIIAPTSQKKDDELILIEEAIPSSIISNGIVRDIDLLGKTLKQIWEKAGLNTHYAIVAIPDDEIYSRIFSFPKSVEGSRLTEAMRLAISFQLPMDTKDAYLDWERTPGTTHSNEILLSTIPRTVAEAYVKALEIAGIKMLALESNLAAIARVIKLPANETVLIRKDNPDGTSVFALKNGTLRFSRTLPSEFVPSVKVPQEIEKITASLSADDKDTTFSVQNFNEAEAADLYQDYSAITTPRSNWLVALGAAVRGAIPDGQDNLVSLLPIGTEEAYSYQRTTTFIVLMRNLTVAVSIFFVVAYLATYLFMISLSQNTNAQILTLSTEAIPTALAQKEAQVAHVNMLSEKGAALISQMPIWSTLIEELSRLTPADITISTFTAPTFAGKMTLSGVSLNRETINDYKKAIQSSELLTEVELPLTNIEKKEKIPFTISFRLKDPSAMYYK